MAGLRKEHDCFKIELILLGGYRFNKPEEFARYQNIVDYHVVNVRSGNEKSKLPSLKNKIIKCAPDVIVPVLSLEGLQAAVQLKDEMGFSIVFPVHEYNQEIITDIQTYAYAIDKIVPVDKLNAFFLANKCHLDIKNFETISGAYRREYHGYSKVNTDRGRDKIKIGIASRWNPQKGSEILENVLSKIPKNRNVEIMWAGLEEVEARKRNSLRRLIEREQLVCLGAVEPIGMMEFHESIDCLLIASSWETGPLIAWDAMYAGNLLIVSSYIGVKPQRLQFTCRRCKKRR